MVLPKFVYPQAAVGGDLKAAEPYWDDDNYVAQEKLDGARYILHKDANGLVRIYSRQISKVTNEPVIKTQQLAHIAREFNEWAPPGTILDGEVVAPSALSSSNLVTKVTGSKPERAIAVQEANGYLHFMAFDCLAYDGTMITEQSYMVRHAALLKLPPWSSKRDGHYLYRLGFVSRNGADKRALYNMTVRAGGEGVILKDIHASYHQGERHKSWVKVKRQRTFDVVFMGVEMANEESIKKNGTQATKTRIAGQVGAIKYAQTVFKEGYRTGLFEVPASRELTFLGTVSGFDDATRADLTSNWQSYIGRVFEVTGQEQFKSGAIRHPRWVGWRDDKNAEDCVFRVGEG